MAIQPTCDKCGDELLEFGGILLSPPNDENVVKKFHICVDCYKKMETELIYTTGPPAGGDAKKIDLSQLDPESSSG